MMNSHGFMAVSVSSETSCLDSEGKLKIDEDQLAILARADEIYLALDQDPAGQKCADAFETDAAFTSNQIKRIQWEFRGKRFEDPKDIGDLYKKDPASFKDSIEKLTQEARMRPPKWRQQFRTVGEMDGAPIKQIIEGFLTEGNIGIGGLSGAGKTFLALSIVKALTTGQPFVGRFKVPEKIPVIYLIPEVGDRQFIHRAKAFGIPDDDSIFLGRTLSQGETLPLDNPWLVSAIRNMGNPVVVLDTATRFSKSKDENSARENLWMEQSMRSLREAGCIAVIALHHSIKKNASIKDFTPSLENTFRGTGDIGALLDIGYCIHKDKKVRDAKQVTITNVKPRDFDPPAPFNLELQYLPSDSTTGKMRSRINESGDLRLVSEVTVEANGGFGGASEADEMLAARGGERGKAFVQAVTENPQVSKRSLVAALKIRHEGVNELAKTLGFEMEDGTWVDTLAEEPVNAF
jgi:hypothetical protein